MKIALLFLTYGNPMHTTQWKPFVDRPDDFMLCLHPKYREMIDPFWEPYCLPHTIETHWASETIVMATLALLQHAYLEGKADWFVLCSEDSYPLHGPDVFLERFRGQTLSRFESMTPPNASSQKTSQWFAMSKVDVGTVLSALDLLSTSAQPLQQVKVNQHPLFSTIVSRAPRKSAIDEWFFVPLLTHLQPGYTFSPEAVTYVNWPTAWTAKHPITFNALTTVDTLTTVNTSDTLLEKPEQKLEKRKQKLGKLENALLIRKTLPTFEPRVIVPKPTAIILTLGTENIGKVAYTAWLAEIRDTCDLYLLVMVDSLSGIEPAILNQCIQVFPVVWNMVDQAYAQVHTLLPHYETITVLKEQDVPSKMDRQTNRHTDSKMDPRMDSKMDSKMDPRMDSKIKMDPRMDSRIKMDSRMESKTDSRMESRTYTKTKQWNPSYTIAYLFLLRNGLNQPRIWDDYFTRESDGRVLRYAHIKDPSSQHMKHQPRWLERALIRDLRPTEWGYIVEAYFALFRTALQQPTNLKFVILSESCVPIHSYRTFRRFLDESEVRESFVHFLPITTYDRKSRIEPHLRGANAASFFSAPSYPDPFCKHYARMCLSRYHVEKLLASPPQAIRFFMEMHVGDEFFLTLLRARPGHDFVVHQTITYDNWDDVHQEMAGLKQRLTELEHQRNYQRNYHQGVQEGKEPEDHEIRSLKEIHMLKEIRTLKEKLQTLGNNPKTYVQLTPRDVSNAFRSHAFFWRKFPAEFTTLTAWYTPYGELSNSKKGGQTRKNKVSIVGKPKKSLKSKRNNRGKREKERGKGKKRSVKLFRK